MDHVTPLALLLLLVPLLLLLHSTSRRRRYGSNQQPKHLLPPSPPGLPIIGHLHLVGDRPHVSLRSLAAKHGGLMLLRLGTVPNLVVSSRRAAQLIMRTHDHAFASRPVSTVSDALLYGSSDIGFAPYGEHWRQVRKLVTTHLFTVKKVNSYRLARQEEVRLVMDKIREAVAGSKAVDISETMNTFANDIVSRVVSGKFFRAEGRNKLFRELIETNTRLIGGFNLQEYFPGLANSLSSLTSWFASNQADEAHKRWDELLETIIIDHEGRRRTSENGHVVGGVEQEDSDFVDVLLSVQKEFSVTRDHIKAILMDMFGAGTDTSSLVLELAMAELMRNPHLMTKLQAEVRENTPRGQEMVAQDNIVRMTYLRAVVKETLRLHPPAPLLLPRLSMVDCEVDGYTIPSGTRVIINEWAISRDPESWEKAEEFMPERFMDGGSATAVDFRGNDFQFVPFGAGRRMCPGLNFGMATVEIMLANLVYCFDWGLPAGMEEEDIDMTEVFGVTVHPKEKLVLVPKLRGDGVHALHAE
ncbi:indole-2-monooxygenase [Dichanthelium oligosanthes]|uniref:Indole-2-monooxygenase n=1 Tax=Dichanthelium oligosanthes TaxID=888268 RepID=A0A1E5W672_9POAL|nr:indole-2-monooxygenase [Dichanthelium oligosanthes]